MSWGVSSKAIRTPGSLYSRAPRTRNSIPSMVLPQPGPPQTMVVRPLGRPPPVISSSPGMPVGDFSRGSNSRTGAETAAGDFGAFALAGLADLAFLALAITQNHLEQINKLG